MSLTVGTTLQNGKFVIKAILHQSDFGVTYQAAHPSTNRPIILQSFNEVLRQRSDFNQLRQKFLQEVLLSSKQPSDTVQVIDCFEDEGMPFVVLESDSNQSIPHLSNWLEIPVEAPDQETAQPTTEAASTLTGALAAAFPESPAEAAVSAAPIAPAPVAETRTEEIAIADAEEFVPVPAEAIATPPPIFQPLLPPDYATNGSKRGVTVLVSGQSSKPRKWMPLALLMTALITGFGGLGLGLAIRFKPTPQSPQSPQSDSTSSLSPSWFGREQSFPPQQDWPITESPNPYSPSSAFEQLPYQSNPSIRESGMPKTQSSTGYIPPAHLAPPDYRPAAPGIADYPPTTPAPDPIPSIPAAVEAPSALKPTKPVIPIPLPQPIVPESPPEAAPDIDKPPAAPPKNVPADAPIIFMNKSKI
jgi:hypothetical protein